MENALKKYTEKSQSRTILLGMTLLLATVACSRSEPVSANTSDEDTEDVPIHLQLVQFGATMYVAAEFCKMDFDTRTREGPREQQKRAMVAKGTMTAAQFDAAFAAAQAQVKARFAALSAADRAQACTELEKVGKPSASG